MAHTKFGVNMPKHCRDTASSVILASCLKFVVVVCENRFVYQHKIHKFLSTKDCFINNLPDLSQFLSISNSSEQLDDVTETMDSLFSLLSGAAVA